MNLDENIADIDAQIAEDIRAVVEQERASLGVCPLMGQSCVGPAACAPANFHAQYLYQIARASSDEPTFENPPAAICPVMRVVDGIGIVAQALLPLVLGNFDAEAAEEDETPPVKSPEEQRAAQRSNVLGKLVIDQQRG